MPSLLLLLARLRQNNAAFRRHCAAAAARTTAAALLRCMLCAKSPWIYQLWCFTYVDEYFVSDHKEGVVWL
jgi:hypothetical protein